MLTTGHYAELAHRQVTSQRQINDATFAQGVIDYNFSIGGNYGFVPACSYFRIGLKLQTFAIKNSSPLGGDDVEDTRAPLRADKIAFADNVAANLFTNIYCRAGGQDISSIVNYAAQADQAKKRLERPGAWLENVGKVYGMNASFKDRVEACSNDPATATTPAGGKESTIYIIYQPPVGMFSHEHPLGAGDYRVQLNPNVSYKSACVERGTFTPPAQAAGSVKSVTPLFSVESMEFYVATCRMTSPPKSIERLNFTESMVQSKKAVAGENNLDFTLPTSTKSISVFLQTQKAGFAQGLNAATTPLTKFTTDADGEKGLRSIQLSYANTTKPSTRWTSAFDGATQTQRLQQRYFDSKMSSGLLSLSGGCEPIKDWLERGVLLHYDFTRDSDDRSTQLQLQCNIPALPADTFLFVVAHYTRTVEIQTDRGFVQAVNVTTT